ncbi:endonuclease VII domain-containing protein [Pseudarthrobacter sp. C4D7]|uniref:endonuclease VII domain-containing protein n=1 Tax=Pseudarthrobacter sp. C4D7 TaxID=2735268 RepID=UPI00353019B9
MRVIVPRYKHASLVRDADGNKQCTTCRQWLPVDKFGKGGSGGLASRCLQCANDASRARKFGITRETYDALLSLQGGVCWLCKQLPNFGRNSLSVDHDHNCCADKYKTCGGCIRGLLCGSCNLALGQFDHNPERLEAAFKYLVEGVPHILAYLQSRADVAALPTRDGDTRDLLTPFSSGDV